MTRIDPAEIVSTMSPTMIRALHEADAGQPLHGREVSSLTTRGLVRNVNGGLVVTGTGDQVLKHHEQIELTRKGKG